MLLPQARSLMVGSLPACSGKLMVTRLDRWCRSISVASHLMLLLCRGWPQPLEKMTFDSRLTVKNLLRLRHQQRSCRWYQGISRDIAMQVVEITTNIPIGISIRVTTTEPSRDYVHHPDNPCLQNRFKRFGGFGSEEALKLEDLL